MPQASSSARPGSVIKRNSARSIVVEVIDVPGLRQLPYTYDQGARQLTAEYDGSLDGVDGWFAVETVTVGAADPCGPLTTADGDGLGTETPGCTQIDGDLWQRADAAGVEGYVLRRDGVTVTLAGPAACLPQRSGPPARPPMLTCGGAPRPPRCSGGCCGDRTRSGAARRQG